MSAYPSYEQVPGSPEPGEEFGLWAALPGGEKKMEVDVEGEWPLLLTTRLGPEFLADLGAAPIERARVVVTHAPSGRVFVGGVAMDGAVPPEPGGFDVEGGSVVAVTGHFNIDVRRQCRVTAGPGRYWVVVMLGPLVTPALQIEARG